MTHQGATIGTVVEPPAVPRAVSATAGNTPAASWMLHIQLDRVLGFEGFIWWLLVDTFQRSVVSSFLICT